MGVQLGEEGEGRRDGRREGEEGGRRGRGEEGEGREEEGGRREEEEGGGDVKLWMAHIGTQSMLQGLPSLFLSPLPPPLPCLFLSLSPASLPPLPFIIVDLITKARGVGDCEFQANALLLNNCTAAGERKRRRESYQRERSLKSSNHPVFDCTMQ